MLSALLQESKPLTDFNANLALDSFSKLRKIMDELINAQNDPVKLKPDLDAFNKWMQANEISFEKIEISAFKEGNGIKAKKNIETSDLLAKIPMKAVFYKDTVGGPFSQLQDQFIKSNDSVSLALLLIQESLDMNSKWRPYIQMLPTQFSIPLFYSEEQISSLKVSPTLVEIVQWIKSILLYYVYISKKLETLKSMPFISLERYLWAIAVVVTRQNPILMNAKGLIPLFDMFNHEQFTTRESGITAFFDDELQNCLVYAPKPVASGNQVYLQYGNRSNQELFIYSGFVLSTFELDRLKIWPKIRFDDPYKALRLELLAKAGLKIENGFAIRLKLPEETLVGMAIVLASDSELKTFTLDTIPEQLTEKVKQWLLLRCTVLEKQYSMAKSNHPLIASEKNLVSELLKTKFY